MTNKILQRLLISACLWQGLGSSSALCGTCTSQSCSNAYENDMCWCNEDLIYPDCCSCNYGVGDCYTWGNICTAYPCDGASGEFGENDN